MHHISSNILRLDDYRLVLASDHCRHTAATLLLEVDFRFFCDNVDLKVIDDFCSPSVAKLFFFWCHLYGRSKHGTNIGRTPSLRFWFCAPLIRFGGRAGEFWSDLYCLWPPCPPPKKKSHMNVFSLWGWGLPFSPSPLRSLSCRSASPLSDGGHRGVLSVLDYSLSVARRPLSNRLFRFVQRWHWPFSQNPFIPALFFFVYCCNVPACACRRSNDNGGRIICLHQRWANFLVPFSFWLAVYHTVFSHLFLARFPLRVVNYTH